MGLAAGRPNGSGDRRDSQATSNEPLGQLRGHLHCDPWSYLARRTPILGCSSLFALLGPARYLGHYNALISCCGHLGLIEEAKFFIEARNRVGPPICVSLLRRNLGGYAHCDIFVEGLVKTGVPE